eukprot:maker-scaffold517_size150149-snap-gene-0.19 protein:Tk02937 transcript:maker-scaffold517_size150149-snap-gene-0.19-mRNA-1 annotation:"---NA---"
MQSESPYHQHHHQHHHQQAAPDPPSLALSDDASAPHADMAPNSDNSSRPMGLSNRNSPTTSYTIDNMIENIAPENTSLDPKGATPTYSNSHLAQHHHQHSLHHHYQLGQRQPADSDATVPSSATFLSRSSSSLSSPSSAPTLSAHTSSTAHPGADSDCQLNLYHRQQQQQQLQQQQADQHHQAFHQHHRQLEQQSEQQPPPPDHHHSEASSKEM